MYSGEVEYFSFWVFDLKSKFGEKVKSNIVTTNKWALEVSKDLLWVMSKPLSTKESKEVWRLRLLSYFSKIWRKEARYKAKRMGDRAEP